jgi:outer membrane protein assembly factor BamB
MSLTGPSYPSPQRNRTSTVLTISILVAFFLLIGLGWMVFAVQNGLVALSTPTATATPLAATRTPTPDVRATNIAGDMLTQVAFAATAIMQLTPSSQPGAQQPGMPQPNAPQPDEAQPIEPDAPTQSLQLPLVSAAEPQPTSPLQPDAALAEALTATALFIPNVTFPENPTPTQTPTVTPVIFDAPSATPVAPVVLPPTETPTPPFVEQPTATPTAADPFIRVESMIARTRDGVDTAAFVGPSTFYTQTEVMLPPNTQIQLNGRTPSGDWLYGCCLNNNQSFWVRPAYLTISNNPTPVNFPAGVDLNSPQWNPNNPKWLPIFPLDPVLAPRPQPTSAPFGDYPLARYDRGNTGRVPMLPRPPLLDGWGGTVQAGASFRSPAAVIGANVISANDDGQVYSLNRENGSQRWRYSLSNTGNLAPAINEGLIYLPYAGNRMIVLQDAGNVANLASDVDLLAAITTSPTFLNDAIFVGVGDGADARLVALKRDNLADRRTFEAPQARLLQPAIGQETIYIAADRLWAVDINFWRTPEVLWDSSRNNVGVLTAPPVYAYPGVIRSAELYVADTSGVFYALDANTGERIWTYSAGSQQTMLAVNNANLFSVGSGFLRAISRQSGQLLWTAPIGGEAIGGPFVTNDRVLVITQSGAMLFYDANTGAMLDMGGSFRLALNAAPAISQEWIFAPSIGSVFGYRGNP